ncbi:MAG: helix-turn-helix transcriptional regulator [Lentisphaeria bacterium]|nr:helix-turn-helix transcriptional regulator [Lentisphaeria bacterium]
MLSHLKKMNMIGFFKAPANEKINPGKALENMEYLELVSGGHTLFSGPDGKNTLYGRGSLFWHKAGENTIYRYHGDDPYSCYVFQFEVAKEKRPCPRVTVPLHTEQLMGFAEDVFRRYHAGEQENMFFGAMVYSTLLWYACGPQRNPGERYPDSLKFALDFMQNHFDSCLHLDEIAAAAGISQPYLFSVFKRYLKVSPHQYLLSLRISRAKQLLASGESAIKEIASDCGFESLEVFYRQFMKQESSTPAAYRKRFSPLDMN